MKLLLTVAAVMALLAGCTITYVASRYSISADNVKTLRTFKGQSVNVAPFSAANPRQTEIKCRGPGGAPIGTPDGEAYEDFVRKAFVDDLTIAEIYSSASPTRRPGRRLRRLHQAPRLRRREDAPITLTGRLDAIDFSSFAEASWSIGLTITSSNGQSLSVFEDYKYPSSLEGVTACTATAQALMPAVQNLIAKVIRHPNFPARLR
jgi:hypothetical protein